MRKAVLGLALAWIAGFLCAGVAAHAYTKLNAWQAFGERFQLGYVAGYIDAAKLSKYKDVRVAIPTQGRARHQHWVDGVNAFYEDSANAGRPVPDAMGVVGDDLKREFLKAYRERRDQALEAAEASRAAPNEAPGSGSAPEPE